MKTLSPQELWGRVLAALAPEVKKEDLELWLQPVEATGLEERLLRLKVPNKFFSEHIRERFQRRVEEILKAETGTDLSLDFSVARDLKTATRETAPIEEALPQSEFKLSELNPRYMFSTFVVGASNRFAHATAEAVARNPGRQFNPFFIYGGVGLGKTHLMHAIGHSLRKTHAHARVLYTTSEQFVNEYIESLRYDKPDAFRSKYRNLDCLLIDDIQFLVGKGRSEEEFFYTFNSLFDAHKQIVVASDRAPKEMAPSEQRLISRFEWGVVSDIRAPDLETRIAILRKKTESEQIFVPDDVILYLATVIKSNIRELEGALIRLSAFASLTDTPLSVDTAKELLRDTLSHDGPITVRVDTILKVVADKYAVDMRDLLSRSRRNEVVFPRQLGMYLASALTPLSTPDIGRAFGGRDHTTVIHARDKIKGLLDKDPFFLETVNKLIERIKSVDNE
ncbi:MAG: chromosomal replication initiator protein DnaA [Elusimicrobia bacterium]|nr:chromosomal replication initiator protein DnaA [Elusimicrobiota bacterium]